MIRHTSIYDAVCHVFSTWQRTDLPDVLFRSLGFSARSGRVVVAEFNGVAAATVSFDDGQVTPEAMTAAITNAGFPAHVQVN